MAHVAIGLCPDRTPYIHGAPIVDDRSHAPATIMVVPGAHASMLEVSPLALHLRHRGMHVVACDPPRAKLGMSVADYASAQHAHMQTAIEKFKLTETHITYVGLSFGALILMKLAETHPRRYTSLNLINAGLLPPSAADERRLGLAQSYAELYGGNPLDYTMEVMSHLVGSAALGVTNPHILTVQKTIAGAIMAHPPKRQPNTAILVSNRTDDRFVSSESVQALTNWAGSNATVATESHGGHLAWLLRPSTVAATIADFSLRHTGSVNAAA